MLWTTSFLGENFEIEAHSPYEARKRTVIEYKKLHPEFKEKPYQVWQLCRVKRHHDRRIRYDI